MKAGQIAAVLVVFGIIIMVGISITIVLIVIGEAIRDGNITQGALGISLLVGVFVVLIADFWSTR